MLYLYGVGGDFRREASGRLHALLGDDSFAGWRRFYTVGAALYGIGKKRKYVHSLWHLFVLAGSIFHFFCIYGCL